MRFLFIGCSVWLITLCIIMEQQSVAAKPFIFKFFLPQEPARTDSSASSSSSTSIFSGIDLTSILTTKLNLLTSLLRTGLNKSVSGGFNFGFKKFLPNTQISSTRRPNTSTTIRTPAAEFEPELSTKSSIKSASTPITSSTTSPTSTSSTTESSKIEKIIGSDNLSEPITNNDNKNNDNSNSKKTATEGADSASKMNTNVKSEVATNNSQNDQITSKVIANGNNNKNNGNNYDNSKVTMANDNGNYDTTTRATTLKPNGHPQTGYNYESSNHAMSENEISNEIMMINNQYLPAYQI